MPPVTEYHPSWIRAIIYYPLPLGRNFDELKGALIALQTAGKHGVATNKSTSMEVSFFGKELPCVILTRNYQTPLFHLNTRFTHSDVFMMYCKTSLVVIMMNTKNSSYKV